jgi:tRNA(Ile)-lysidine synthase
MLTKRTKELLCSSKNLLAFSAGVDSTALFFLLHQNNIPFDIAIVDYGLREQSKEEVAYAKQVAKEHNKKCYLKTAPKIESNFEANAREIRYSFFEELIALHHYDNLLTAHHLGDRFEWFLMQFCKGAGCVELSGMREVELRKGYRLIRPLLHLDKQELLEYLNTNHIHYFQDSSNEDEKYSRNYFRKKHTNPLLKEYLTGIKKSFEYLDKDRELLIEESEIQKINQLACFQQKNKRSNIYMIDKYLKSIGHIMTKEERALLQEQKSVVIGRKYIVTKVAEYICIAPYIKADNFTKEFKEKMRVLKIEPKLRGYLASDVEAEEFLSRLFS